MNKQLATKSSTLNKNMTNTENLSLDNLTTKNIILPIYKTTDVPSEPPNPTKGMLYIEYNTANAPQPYTIMIYDNGTWN